MPSNCVNPVDRPSTTRPQLKHRGRDEPCHRTATVLSTALPITPQNRCGGSVSFSSPSVLTTPGSLHLLSQLLSNCGQHCSAKLADTPSAKQLTLHISRIPIGLLYNPLWAFVTLHYSSTTPPLWSTNYPCKVLRSGYLISLKRSPSTNTHKFCPSKGF